MERKRGLSKGTKLGPMEEWPSVVWTDTALRCIVRIDSWLQRKKEPRKKWEVHKFGINLSYMELENAPDGDYTNVIRFDCQHFHAEVHEFWQSSDPVPLKWAKDKSRDRIFSICSDDIKSNYREYIGKMRDVRVRERGGSND